MLNMLIPETTYDKKDLYRLLHVPEDKQGGEWDTGYIEYEGHFYLFVNIGTAGRSGPNYDNYWEGDRLVCIASLKGMLVNRK